MRVVWEWWRLVEESGVDARKDEEGRDGWGRGGSIASCCEKNGKGGKGGGRILDGSVAGYLLCLFVTLDSFPGLYTPDVEGKERMKSR